MFEGSDFDYGEKEKRTRSFAQFDFYSRFFIQEFGGFVVRMWSICGQTALARNLKLNKIKGFRVIF